MTTDTTPETFSNINAVLAAIRRAAINLVPPPDMLPSEFAEANISIPLGNAIPGKINFSNAPYQRGMIDVVKERGVRRVTYMTGAQLGKTTAQQCITAYFVAHEPKSQIFCCPTQGDVLTFMEGKMKPMIEANPSISGKMAKARGREGVNNSRLISYYGGWMMLAWAGSTKTLRGRSAPITHADEIDAFEATAEGNALELLAQRSATYGDQQLRTESSTPTIKGGSNVEVCFNEGDQRRYYVACPDCNEPQYFRWEQVRWDGRQSVDVKTADKDIGKDHDPASALYCCEHCGTLWDDGQRIAAIRNAERMGHGWKASKQFKGHASFHAPELLSTFRRLRDIVQSYLDKLAVDDLQSFVNVSLGETFEEANEKADPSSLLARAQRAEWGSGIVPRDGVFLSAGIDAQNDRLECEVVAWGIGEQSWSVEYMVFWGDPLAGDVWMELEDYLETTFKHESGVSLPISAACLDTGGTNSYTQTAYDWLKGKTSRSIFGVKGVAGWGRPVVEKPQRKQSGKNARKIDLFLVGVDEAKLIVSRRLAIPNPGPGYSHFPNDRDEEYFQQLTSEKLLTRYVKGFPVKEWHKPDRARNEALDCRVYAFAAMKIKTPNFKKLAERIANASPVEYVEKQREAPAPALLESQESWTDKVADKAIALRDAIVRVREASESRVRDATAKPQEEHKPDQPQTVVIKTKRTLQKRSKSGSFATKW